MLAPDGAMLCRCGQERIDWYLSRDLAVLESDDPPTIRLNFEPSGRRHVEDEFYLQEKENICVICGGTENLSKHHVVPYCFRKFFPEHLKKHSYHDVLLLCRPHHDEYEKEADKLKAAIANEYDISMQGYGISIDEQLRKVHDAAWSLLRNGRTLRRRKKDDLKKIIRSHLGKKQVYHKDIIAASQISYNIKNDEYKEYGKFVIENVKSLEEFIIRWRAHFVEHAKPKFLPEYWKVDRTIKEEIT